MVHNVDGSGSGTVHLGGLDAEDMAIVAERAHLYAHTHLIAFDTHTGTSAVPAWLSSRSLAPGADGRHEQMQDGGFEWKMFLVHPGPSPQAQGSPASRASLKEFISIFGRRSWVHRLTSGRRMSHI